MSRSFSLFVLALLSAGPGPAQTCSQVVQNGVSFTLDGQYPCGQFANGDYWVAPLVPGGGVVISHVDPAFDGSANGWEVNPAEPNAQGFDSRISSFDSGRVPQVPYVAHGGESLVKGVSVAPGTCRPCLKSASILTVLDTPPAAGGAALFRPPYPGDLKPLLDTSTLRLDELPELAPVPSAPTFSEIASDFAQPWLDHKQGWTGRPLHPIDSMPGYGADIAALSGDAALGLMLQGDPNERYQAAVNVVQVGLDLYYAYLNGTTWSPNGGHSPGRRILLALAATLMDDSQMVDVLAAAPVEHFGEDGSVVVGSAAGIPLFGQSCTEQTYWNRFRFGSGARACEDPYGAIDGGELPGGVYQYCCNSSPWRGSALALRLMPALQCAWPADPFLGYVDRWVNAGTHSQPDTCAPYDGIPSNYGITYGPDGLGGCIADINPSDGVGRFPARHGTAANQGNHGSVFHGDMWATYRSSASVSPPPCGVIFADGFETGDTQSWS